MIWHQGESDASLKTERSIEAADRVHRRVRTDLETADLPFGIGEVYDNGKRDTIREARRRLRRR